jgi:hypothetical protein
MFNSIYERWKFFRAKCGGKKMIRNVNLDGNFLSCDWKMYFSEKNICQDGQTILADGAFFG